LASFQVADDTTVKRTVLPFSQMSQFRVNVVIPRIGIRSIIGTDETRVSRLAGCFPNQSVAFIHEGELMEPERTFGEYNLRDNNYIVAMPDQGDQPSMRRAWLDVTRRQDDFAARVAACLSNDTRKEIFRLRDLETLRREQRSNRLTMRFGQVHSGASMFRRQTGFFPSVITESPAQLCEDPLPCAWADGEGFSPV
jgi:hypothetical protein